MPKLSIGLPVYNGEKLVARSIESLLAQDYRDFELVIADNQSTDGTSAICRRYAQSDPRIRYVVNESNIGAAANHNRVVELARGEYFKWAAHDDECFPTMLSRCVETMDGAPPDAVMVYPQSVIIDEFSNVIGEYKRSIASDESAPHRRLAAVLLNVELGTPMYGIMRTSALRKTRLIEGFHSSDFVLFAELAMLGKIKEVPEMLFKKRFHPGRSMQAYRNMSAYIRWLNPASKDRPPLFAGKLPWEYLRSIRRAPIGPVERVLCVLYALAIYYRRDNESRVERWKKRIKRLAGVRSSTQSSSRREVELPRNA
jgi:glycosyltransferase involved in cell wall biosynthesis